jgi:hypothetical protein
MPRNGIRRCRSSNARIIRAKIRCIRPVQTYMSHSRDPPASRFAHTQRQSQSTAPKAHREILRIRSANPIVGSEISHACGLSCPRKSSFTMSMMSVLPLALAGEGRRQKAKNVFVLQLLASLQRRPPSPKRASARQPSLASHQV